ncbi:MAG: hypothetical protein ACD_55C00119G0005 [uncultured bacterium]|uniref:Phage integrase family protein n=1 Tax=Citrifermentans bemidjiense (strain ATCC BAA-1014 / DSM 16622 / JCM 12645 / Bem) TaxID=404380 RepID=B5EC35_CITBB|nr:integrase family protein [Citrifermentans bemidjiense]ACH40491.1 phage integrase family protein [Citrifermentans bemidjiense Bem]EKD59189.1 MAG: hypothetical protein ACD_55C00119G0005 [uncultured bacterium]
MPTIHITKTAIDKLERPAEGRVDYFDDALRGFGIRVSPSTKTYFVMRRVNGKLVRAKIDTADKITAEQARKRAEGALADMGRGQDPNEEKRAAKKRTEDARKEEEAQKSQVVTLEDALKVYLEKRKLKPKTLATYKQLFRLHLSDWLQLPAGEITSTMVAQRHTDIATGARNRTALKKAVVDKGKGKPKVEKSKVPDSQRREASADGTMRVLRAVLNYTFGDDEELGIVRPNPVRTLSRKKAWYKVPRRRNLIKNSDLPAWSKAVLALENAVARDYLLFLLHTGLRRNEAACLQWQHVDFEDGCFTIIDTKNKEPHTLPLSDYLHTLLEGRKEGLKTELEAAKAALEASLHSPEYLTPKQRQAFRNRVAAAESRLQSPYVFPGSGRAGYIADPQKALEAVTQATGIIFSCHDLRRTFATIAESLDLSKYTIKALLNHKEQSGDVTGGYIILNADRLREPMQKMTDAIQERIKKQHGQVVPIQAKAE